MAARYRLACGLVVAVALAWYSATHLQVTSAITHFLPAGTQGTLPQLSESLTQSELARSMILAVVGADSQQVVAASRELADALGARPEVAWMRRGLPDDMPERVFALYQPRRWSFVSLAPEAELPPALSDDGLRAAARRLKRELAAPSGSMLGRLAPADPLLAFPDHLRRMERQRGSELRLVDGQFLSPDGQRAFLFFATYAAAFDTALQRPLLEFIDARFAEIAARHGGGLTLEQSGLSRFAVDSERIMVSDIERVSLLSSIGVLGLFWLLYRSLRYVALGLVPFAFGMLGAASVTLFVFSRVHAITLAFGSTLIGVCIDYPVHYFNHHFLDAQGKSADESLRDVWPGLLLGCLTSVVVFAGLGVSSFPGIREVAVFGATGVIAALVAMRALVPPLLPRTLEGVAGPRRMAALLSRGLEHLGRRRSLQLLPALAASLVTVLGASHVRWLDDLRSLAPVSPEVLAQSEALRGQVSAMDAGRFVVSWGPDLEHALQGNERVAAALRQARADGVVAEYQSLETWLWSESLQRRNVAMFQAAPELGARVQRIFTEEGFAPAAFEPYVEALRRPAAEPLRMADLTASPLADLVRTFTLPMGDRVAVLSYLRGVRDPSALAERIAPLGDAMYFDQTEFLTRTYSRYRSDVVRLTVAGLAAVLLIVWLHYRRWALALAAFLPAVLAAALTAVVLGLAGRSLTLLHVMALLLVLGMSVDYGVFLTESVSAQRDLGPTLVSLFVASLTTILSFGLLALSRAPALKAIGEATCLGMAFSVLLAPSILVALRGQRRAA